MTDTAGSAEIEALRIGSLCSGYGGLEMGVQAVMGGTTVWVSDIDKGACKILAHRFPGVPNIGDMTTVDWAVIEPVDLICGGTPCQDLSHAGKRAGMAEGTRSNLWVAMREAIAVIRPKYVVWENVRGAYSAAADSEVEPCPGCVGDGSGVHLRALGRVLGDLSDLGYDASWHGLRAADVGAPHGRFRVFVVATDARDGARHREWSRPKSGQGSAAPAVASGIRRGEGRATEPGEEGSGWTPADLAGRGLLPTPTTRDTKGHNQRRDETCLTGALLPTPRAGDGEKGGPNQRGSSGDLMLPSAVTLLPTPRVTQAGYADDGRGGKSLDVEVRSGARWGEYADAIGRWEQATRPAPPPTQPGAKGSPRLSAAFSEWMMGVPAGWVTGVPGITRNEALKACGNGVVPQQAAAALAEMLTWSEAVA